MNINLVVEILFNKGMYILNRVDYSVYYRERPVFYIAGLFRCLLEKEASHRWARPWCSLRPTNLLVFHNSYWEATPGLNTIWWPHSLWDCWPSGARHLRIRNRIIWVCRCYYGSASFQALCLDALSPCYGSIR